MRAADAFAAAARDRRAAPALLWAGGGVTTFEELDRQSNRVARLLLDRGARRDGTVCLSLEKSPLAYAALLGCLKIGVPYFFLDPANPAARTRAMLARCRPSLAIVDAGVSPAPFDCAVLDARDAAGADDDGVEAPWRFGGADPAYIMFTSGSTGEPKGVTISHDNLLHFMEWSRRELGTTPSDVFSNVNPLFFDNSVFDIYASLFSGAALVPVTAAMLRRPQEALAHLDDAGCTVFFSVPSLLVYLQTMKLVDGASFPSARVVMFGGEGYPKPMLRKLFDAIGGRVTLLNVYGPTECTCIASAYRVTAADVADVQGLAPLGEVDANFSRVILDAEGRPAPDGAVGELCLGGPCVGLGYFNDPAQTARAFVQNPAHDRYFDRVYRTGDLVRVGDDGKLYFMGRADSQIKHQGYRIELGEIEHALGGVDAVDEAAAVHLTAGGASRLVAVVASRQPLAGAEIRASAARVLPPYMLPERVIVVAALPKNANGKIDRPAIRAAIEQGELA